MNPLAPNGSGRRFTMLGGIALVLFISSLPQGAEWIPFRVSETESLNLVPPSAQSVYGEAPVVDPEVELMVKDGMGAMGIGDLPEARRAFVSVLQRQPEHMIALVNLGWIAQREKAWPEAEAYLKRAQRHSLDNASVWLALGLVYLEQSRIDRAVAAFAQVAALDPDNARGHRMFGLALGRKGWYLGAEAELRRSLELEPNDPGAHFNLAVIYLQRQPVALELARRHYHRAVDLGSAPDSAIESLLTSPVEGADAVKTSAVRR